MLRMSSQDDNNQSINIKPMLINQLEELEECQVKNKKLIQNNQSHQE